jgi:Ca2+:H+ antiporter
VFVQTIRHRDYFLPVEVEGREDQNQHVAPPSRAKTLSSGAQLLIALIVVVVVAKLLSPWVEQTVVSSGAPKALVGVIIAALVLAPESIAAIRAALADRLQTSFNLALGSALASIGLTIPTVALLSITLGAPLTLGISPVQTTLLLLTLLAGITTLATGKTAVLQGVVHIVIFLAYLFLTIVP